MSGVIDRARAKIDAMNAQQSAENQASIDSIINGRTLNGDDYNPLIGISGSPKEVTGRVEGLQRARVLTGQNSYEIGKDYQEAYGDIKKRTQLSDTGSELLRANKAGAVADARNQMQSQGVKGGAALGAVSQVERAKSYDVNNQLVDHQRNAEKDYMLATKANANFTNEMEMGYGQMALGKDVKSPSNNSGGFSSVICTELYGQGYLSKEIYFADSLYGIKIRANKPEVYVGYRAWADKLVPIMQKSKLFTKAVAFFAVPWAMNMAGEKSFFGKIISNVGEPACGYIGKTIIFLKSFSGDSHVRN